jgi:two-component system chemotaxis sensor kinase CheA
MGFEFDMSAEDIKVFLDEAEEQLQMIESGVLRLEKEPDNPEHLQEIFRAAHTLKGSSATLGHKRMAEVTHAMENILDKLRKGKLHLTTEIVDTFFASLDVLIAFKEEIATGQESGVETKQILGRLAAVDRTVEPQAPRFTPSVDGPTPTVARSSLPPLSASEERKLQSVLDQGGSPLWAVLRLEPDTAMPAVRAFQLLLAVEEMGEIIRSWPTQAEVEEDKLSEEIRILFVSPQPAAHVRTTLQAIPDLQLILLDPLQGEVMVGVQSEMAQAAAAVMEQQVWTEGETELSGDGVGQTDRGSRNATRTVRVDVDVLDNLMNLVGELVIDRTRLTQVLTRLEADREGDEMIQIMAGAVAHISRMTGDLQEEIQRARMLPVDNLFRKFPRMVRDTAQRAGREVAFTILGEETELDRSVIEEIGDPLMHLLRNAVDHGIEPPADRVRVGKSAKGSIVLEAFHEENHIIISVRDDGRGIDPNTVRETAVRKGLLSEEAAKRLLPADFLNFIWQPGFSTAEKVSDISGRGVGLDVVHKNIEKLNGAVEIISEVGKGTEFRVKLPLTLAIIRSLQVRVLETTYCIPLGAVVETDRIERPEIQTVRQREVILKRGEVIPLIRLTEAFALTLPSDYIQPEELFVVIVSVMGKQIGIVVDELIGEGDVVIKPLGTFIGDVPGVSGATIMGDGDVAIILDISSLINTVRDELNRTEVRHR